MTSIKGVANSNIDIVGQANFDPSLGYQDDDLLADAKLVAGWIPGLSVVTLNGADVSALTDVSTNSVDISQGTPAAQPAWVPNGLNDHPILRFTGIEYLVNTGDLAALDTDRPVVIAVFKTTTAAGLRALFDEPIMYQLFDNAGTMTWRLRISAADVDTTSTGLAVDTWEIWAGYYNQTVRELHRGLTQKTTAAETSVLDPPTVGETTLGALDGGASGWEGDIAALLIFADITIAELSTRINFLRHRFALGLR